MLTHPSRALFTSTLMLGALIAISSPTWFTAWVGLELNLLSFIPIMSSKLNMYAAEAALKYFLIQALGSATILASSPVLLLFNYSPNLLISVALLLKMGAAPLHLWFPPVMQGIGWGQCIILMTIQKIAPMLLLSYHINSPITEMIFISSILSGLAGSIGGLNQTLFRKIMAYSSVNHMAWMLAAISFSTPLWTNYFVIYSIVSFSVVLILLQGQIFHFNQMLTFSLQSPLLQLAMLFSLLSLGGVPPFLGFWPKMMVINELALGGGFVWLSVLLGSALITLYFYLRVISAALTLSTPKIKISLGLASTPLAMFATIACVNLTPLITPMSTLLPF
uniref:NADH-ubiquinone oxidoreductase chain 2 n=1 Tax=Pandalus hypsinotus TaxID=242778 RepID=A0A4D5XX30_PANHY|nr:NADH dehydrogenase subunit 2 [Pandalus hypsinotus]